MPTNVYHLVSNHLLSFPLKMIHHFRRFCKFEGHRLQCDQIRRFLEFLGNKFITKVAKLFGDFLGSCVKHCFLSQPG